MPIKIGIPFCLSWNVPYNGNCSMHRSEVTMENEEHGNVVMFSPSFQYFIVRALHKGNLESSGYVF